MSLNGPRINLSPHTPSCLGEDWIMEGSDPFTMLTDIKLQVSLRKTPAVIDLTNEGSSSDDEEL